MKNFSVCFFITLIFAAVVFSLGWTQLRLRPDSCGVLLSKTGGIQDEPLLPGEFSWNWEFLLPTNAQLRQFSIKPLNVTKTVSGQLPSGSLYASAPDNFDYHFVFSISLTLSPEAVVELVRLNRITDEADLEEYLGSAADSIAQLAADYYLKKASETPGFRPESVRREDIMRGIQTYRDFPEVELFGFALSESKIPDYALYQRLRTQNQNMTAPQQALAPPAADEENEDE